MKVIIFFTLFVTIYGTSLLESRILYRPNHDVIQGFVRSTSEVKKFNDLLNSSNEFQKVNEDSFFRKSKDIRFDLSDYFANAVLGYMNILLKSYCILALKKTYENKNIEDIIAEIKLDKDQDFHVVSFLMHMIHRVYLEEVFHAMWFFKSLIVEELDNNGIKYLRNTINDFYTITEEYEGDQLDNKLKAVKTKIKVFSKLFYSPNIPQIVDTDSLLEIRNYEYTDYTLKSHILFSETFQMIFQKFNHSTSNEVERIRKWECSPILDSLAYEEDQQVGALKKMVDETAKAMHDFFTPGPGGSPQTEFVININLATLRKKLQTNFYYLNLVLFYNMVSEVLVYSLWKEGTKILKGIAYKCRDNNEHSITEDDLRMMKTALFQFKVVYDELFNQILEKYYVDVNEVHVKQHFDDLAKNILKHFETIENGAFNDGALKSNCVQMIDEIKLLVNVTVVQENPLTQWFHNISKPRSPANNVTNLKHRFNERHFFAPLSNIVQVYEGFDEFFFH